MNLVLRKYDAMKKIYYFFRLCFCGHCEPFQCVLDSLFIWRNPL
ncbi:hypothetical protein D1BOALGB6SA_5754 [Olavius sp. associated proteobacterium Delta 1]|nr:hypothetical protein D1BOALGB6SA_5754 [Olavius sp. associated proteobacterium Delta 1]